MDLGKRLDEAEAFFRKEPRLISLPRHGKAVFVGDTHGDLDATREVIGRYLRDPFRIVFLGDYVDRGPASLENILFLLDQKVRHPDRLTLLAGNHEGYGVKSFSPAHFWERLLPGEGPAFERLFSFFPLAVSSANGVLGVHGGLPDLGSLGDVQTIRWGGPQWERITWGDFAEQAGDFLGDMLGRPLFGRTCFEGLMTRYGKKLLIRSHQPFCQRWMFDNRCLTLFTSSAYASVRQVAVFDLESEIKGGQDIDLVTI
jgi:hypothetical protein